MQNRVAVKSVTGCQSLYHEPWLATPVLSMPVHLPFLCRKEYARIQMPQLLDASFWVSSLAPTCSGTSTAPETVANGYSGVTNRAAKQPGCDTEAARASFPFQLPLAYPEIPDKGPLRHSIRSSLSPAG